MAKIPCKGKTTTGSPCRAPAGSDGLCFLHANPDKAKVLGQAGGRKNRRQMPEAPVPRPTCAADLTDILAQAITDVRSRRLSPRAAGAISQLCNSLHRILPNVELETRVARLEQQRVGRVPTDDVPTSLHNHETAISPREEVQSVAEAENLAPYEAEPSADVQNGPATCDESDESACVRKP
jgi:hypothetical protein